jgi:RNA polymerase sigma-70 factor (ECF subfamily)
MGTRRMHRAAAMTNSALTPAQSATAPTAPRPDFDEAFTLHHRAVYGAAYSLLRDAGLAEDVTQEAFLRLYSNLETAPPGELLRPWLLRVAINLSYNTMRTRTRAESRADRFAEQTVGLEGVSESVEADFERRAEIEEARRALAKIDEPMRSCLLLKQQGLSYREIAAAVSVNESYVGSLIARGRKEFARVYGKVGGRR